MKTAGFNNQTEIDTLEMKTKDVLFRLDVHPERQGGLPVFRINLKREQEKEVTIHLAANPPTMTYLVRLLKGEQSVKPVLNDKTAFINSGNEDTGFMMLKHELTNGFIPQADYDLICRSGGQYYYARSIYLNGVITYCIRRTEETDKFLRENQLTDPSGLIFVNGINL